VQSIFSKLSFEEAIYQSTTLSKFLRYNCESGRWTVRRDYG